MVRLVQVEQDAILWPAPRGPYDSGQWAEVGDEVRLAELASLEAELLGDVRRLTGCSRGKVSGPLWREALEQLGRG
jgi:hypothetical protein